MKKASENQAAETRAECAGALRGSADKGERARAQGRWQGTRGNGQGAGSGNAGSGKRKAGRHLPSKARRFDWADGRRKDLAKPIEHLHYVEQLLDQYVDAKSPENIDWVKREMKNALVDAIGAIVEVHQML